MSLKEVFRTVQKESVIIGKIMNRNGNQYVVQDKRGRNYTVRSVSSFSIGQTVIVKNGIILHRTNNLNNFESFSV